MNNDIESLKGGLGNFIEYYRTGNVEITENSFVYTDTNKNISIDFKDCKKYIVHEKDFEKNSITHQEIPNKNINNYGKNIANNSTTIKEEVNIDNSCPSFDCGLCSFFSSCCGGG